MPHIEYLSAASLEMPRTPDDLYDWVMGKCDELGSTLEAKTFARSGALLAKTFYDEIFPLAIYVRAKYAGRQDVFIRPNLGNDNYDAEICIGLGPKAETSFVETTYSKDGYDDALRIEYLTKNGHANLTGPLTVNGRQGHARRTIEIESEAIDRRELVARHIRFVEERIRAKSVASYGSSHVLLVAVDDYLPFRGALAAAELHEAIISFLKKLTLNFSSVVVVGVAGTVYFSYPLLSVK